MYYRYNEDFEKENDVFDSMKKGKECDGGYCLNCDYFDSCTNEEAKIESCL